jgi:hypothetical protein
MDDLQVSVRRVVEGVTVLWERDFCSCRRDLRNMRLLGSRKRNHNDYELFWLLGTYARNQILRNPVLSHYDIIFLEIDVKLNSHCIFCWGGECYIGSPGFGCVYESNLRNL